MHFEQATFLIIVASMLSRGVHGLLRQRGPAVAVSMLITLVYLTCMFIPAHLQRIGVVDSKLVARGFAQPPQLPEIDDLCVLWSTELALVLLVEIAVTHVIRKRQRSKSHVPSAEFASEKGYKLLANSLIVFGLLASVALPNADIAERAASGQGAATLLRTLLICGLAMLCFYGFFKSNSYLAVTVVGVAFLVAQNVRSPLLVLLIAYLAGLMARRELTGRKLSILAALSVCFSVLGAFMSASRANETRNYGLSTSEIFFATIRSPWRTVYESGIDTLDGYRLSRLLAGDVTPNPYDFLSVATNFVPRMLWPDKPTDFTVQISSDYLGYGSSGQYLSPVGYLTLSFGSYIAAVTVFATLVALAVSLASKFGESFWLVIILTAVFRFALGGSAFDIYYCATLVLCVLIVKLGIRGLLGIRIGPLSSGRSDGRSPTPGWPQSSQLDQGSQYSPSKSNI